MVFLDNLFERCLQNDIQALLELRAYQFTFATCAYTLDQLEEIKPDDPRYSQALSLCAYIYGQAKGGPQNHSYAIELHEKAIGLKNALAMTNRATMYQEGLKGSSNSKAIELYEQAILLGDSHAMLKRADLYLKNLCGAKDKNTKDKSRAFALLKKAVSLGNSAAMVYLADLYARGSITGLKDYLTAIDLYEQAITLGNSSALYRRAGMHRQSLGTSQPDLDAASHLYYQAFQKGHFQSFEELKNLATETQHLLAKKYLIHIYVETKQLYKAKTLYNANKSLLTPLLTDELIILFARLPERATFTKTRSLDNLLERCLKNDTQALIDLREYQFTFATHVYALDLLEDIKPDDPLYSQALSLCAFIYGQAKGGPKNHSYAINLYENAIDLGNTFALTNRALIGVMYQENLTESNFSKIIAWLDQAIELNDSFAMIGRADMHIRGLGGAKDKSAAIALLKKAVSLGNSAAMVYLAYLYARNSITGLENYPEAIKLYEQAITLGNSIALYRRANMHRQDLGSGQPDLNEASHLYYQAFQKGHLQSFEELKNLATKEQYPIAQKYLILIYVQTKQLNKATALYNTNSTLLAPLLIGELNLLLAKFSKDLVFTEQLYSARSQNEVLTGEYHDGMPKPHFVTVHSIITFLLKDPSISAYFSFKCLLNEGNELDAFNLYAKDAKAFIDYLTAHEFFRLGNVILNQLTPDEENQIKSEAALRAKIERLTHACWFYCQAYRKGDTAAYNLLMNLLIEKDALEKKSPALCAYEFYQANPDNPHYNVQPAIDYFIENYMAPSAIKTNNDEENAPLTTYSTQHVFFKGKQLRESIPLATEDTGFFAI